MSGYEASEDDTVGEIYEKLKCKLEKHKSDDIRTGFTNYGPHRDDIEYNNGKMPELLHLRDNSEVRFCR